MLLRLDTRERAKDPQTKGNREVDKEHDVELFRTFYSEVVVQYSIRIIEPIHLVLHC